MPSPRLDADLETGPAPGTVVRLLDPAFGLFIWAGHFLVVYIAAAVACQLGLGAASGSARATFLAALALATVVTAAVLALHAFLRYRQARNVPDQRFRMTVTIGCDAIAAVAVVWQFFPLLMVPLCA